MNLTLQKIGIYAPLQFNGLLQFPDLLFNTSIINPKAAELTGYSFPGLNLSAGGYYAVLFAPENTASTLHPYGPFNGSISKLIGLNDANVFKVNGTYLPRQLSLEPFPYALTFFSVISNVTLFLILFVCFIGANLYSKKTRQKKVLIRNNL